MCNYSDGVWNDGRIAGKLDGLREGRLNGLREGRLSGLQEGRTAGLREGRTDGIRIGTVNTTNSLMTLFAKLRDSGRTEDMNRAISDREYLNKLLAEFGQTEAAER